jgi:hypothetical protein
MHAHTKPEWHRRLQQPWLLVPLACFAVPSHADTQLANVRYTASSAVIANPERGLYRPINCNTPQGVSTFASFRAAGNTLVHCYFRLDSFLTSPISQSTLDAFQAQMDNMRAGGVKAVLRFTYNLSDNGADPALQQLYGHMDQLAPYLSRNKDVIAVVQAGFIGSWGEHANSQHYGQIQSMTSQNLADRAAIATKQLQITPAERMVQLRFPRNKISFDGSTPVGAADAFNGSAKSRHGLHNDCFLSTPTDWGTYVNTSTEYPYLAADSTYTVMGGETCKLNPPRTDCPTALNELAMFHWSYLNQGYNVDVLNSWRNQGCYTQVQQKLGYRFVLQNGTYSMSAKPGGAFTASFTVKNDGWAAPYNARDVELVFRNNASGTVYRSKLNVDPRKWLAGSTATVSQTVTLPADMAQGNYTVLLNLPDPMASLRNRPEYAIQLANNSVWEANTGFNNLNHTVKVTNDDS